MSMNPNRCIPAAVERHSERRLTTAVLENEFFPVSFM